MKWSDRESQRIESGHYEMTEVLVQINDLYPGYFIHVAKADRQLVAYTQSIEKGERDIQTPIKLGVFMRKLNNLWRDTYIADQVANHFAELNISFELLSGPKVTACYDLYSWGSCMSKKDFTKTYRYDVLGNFYDGNTLHVALVKDGNGTPIGRSVVDPIRKVYIRSYGDRQKVARVLKNAGYELGGYVSSDENPRQYAVNIVEDAGSLATAYLPYLDDRDANGGDLRGCLVRHKDGSYTLALVKNGYASHQNLDDQNFYMGTVTTTSGLLQLRCYNRDDFKVAISSNKIDLLAPGKAVRHRFVKFYENGGISERLISEVPEDSIERYTYVDGNRLRVYCDVGTPSFDGYIENEYNRRRAGYLKLDAEWYPDKQGEWYAYRQVRLIGDKYALPEDVHRLYTLEGMQSVYKTDPRLEGAIKVHGGELVEKAAEHRIVRTNTKVKVVPGLHEIVYASTSEGYQWMFKRSAMLVRDGDLHYWVPRRGGRGPSPTKLYQDNLYAYLTGERKDYQSPEYSIARDEAMRVYRSRGLLSMFGVTVVNGKYHRNDIYRTSEETELTPAMVVSRANVIFRRYTEGAWPVLLRYLAEVMAVDYNVKPEIVQVPEIEEVTA